jgi:3-oxoacyl-[acyl-carrier-protein] synthase II
VGLVLGTYTAGVHASSEYLETYLRQGATASPALLFSNTVGNAAASTCGLDLGLRGPNVTLMEKEASGLSAVAFGAHLVRHRKAAAVLAGGADALERHFYRVHDWFGVLSPHGADPRPFDRARAGFLMGEGAFLVVLEDTEAARARGAAALAPVLGTGSTASCEPVNAWPGSPRAIARAMRLAIASAGLPPDAIDVVYAAANGTDVLDRCEASAIGEVFGGRAVAVTSIKGAIGEFGASGAASLAAAILCGARGEVPPVAGLIERDAECAVDAVPCRRPAAGPVALVNSVASGGTCVSMVVRTG